MIKIFKNRKDKILTLLLLLVIVIAGLSYEIFVNVSPNVSTQNALTITSNSAKLNGVTSRDGVTTYGFEYGKTNKYGGKVENGEAKSNLNPNSLISEIGVEKSSNKTGEFNSLTDIVLDDSDNLYVNDSGYKQIQKFDSKGNFLFSFNDEGKFVDPKGLGVDAKGNIYVLDAFPNKDFDSEAIVERDENGFPKLVIENYAIIKIFDKEGKRIGEITDFGDETEKDYFLSNDMYVLPNGEILYTIYDTVIKIGSDGKYLSKFKKSKDTLTIVNSAVADSEGNVFVSNNKSEILKYSSDGKLLGEIGKKPLFFSDSSKINIDDKDSIYIADRNSSVQKINTKGELQYKFSTINVPIDVAVSSDESIYLTQTYNNFIEKYSYSKKNSNFQIDIKNLKCNTTYHYRAYSINSGGKSYGKDKTFKTNAC